METPLINACDGEAKTPSVVAIGEGLLALDRNLHDLEAQEDRLIAQRKLIHEKMKIAYEAVRDLMKSSGLTYEPRSWPKFPELHSED